MTGFWTDFMSSVWNFCCWLTDVPPGETSPSSDERGETSVFADYPNTKPTKIQRNRKQGFRREFPQHFNHTTFEWKGAFVSRHFSCFDCQSRILHFAIRLLFLLVSLLEGGSKCWVNNAEIRFRGLWFMSVCTFFILTKKSDIKELSIILLTHP